MTTMEPLKSARGETEKINQGGGGGNLKRARTTRQLANWKALEPYFLLADVYATDVMMKQRQTVEDGWAQ
jgi:hypothetical protein